MRCGHGGYQCLPPIATNGPGGGVQLFVVMWCPTCGDISTRLPQNDAGDEKVAALRHGAAVPLKGGRS